MMKLHRGARGLKISRKGRQVDLVRLKKDQLPKTILLPEVPENTKLMVRTEGEHMFEIEVILPLDCVAKIQKRPSSSAQKLIEFKRVRLPARLALGEHFKFQFGLSEVGFGKIAQLTVLDPGKPL